MASAKSNRRNDLIQLILSLGVIFLLTYIGTFYFHRFDLTSEKRHSLSPATKSFMENLKDVVYVRVYLHGDIPADYQRLEEEVKEKLDEMRAYSHGNLQYEFINPSEANDKKTRNAFYHELSEKGLDYTSLHIKEKDGAREQIIFPGALVSYHEKVLPVQFLSGSEAQSTDQQINDAINNLEYEFANTIQRVTTDQQQSIAFLEGNGELSALETEDITKQLSKLYSVSRVRLDEQVNALSKNIADGVDRQNKYDALIIAKPDSAFSEKDKYLIDQFIMYGGKVLWLIDPMKTDLDSLRKKQTTIAIGNELNLDDQLFTYGVRLNRDLVLDRSCAPIGLMTGPPDNQHMQLFPWYFSPILIPRSSNPIVHNVDPIKTEFLSTLDTIARPGIKKTILLTTSPYTRLYRSPARVSLNIVSIDPDFAHSNTPDQPVCALLEGKFSSVFKDRLSPKFLKHKVFGFKAESDTNRMIVMSDGDVIKNRTDPATKRFWPLGFDRYARAKVYGNAEFIMNCMNYLLGDKNLISIRSRDIKLRKLDVEQATQQRTYWQILNIAGPVVLVIVLGFVFGMLRRRRFAH